MRNTTDSDKLTLDERELSRTANTIRQESEGFNKDLEALEECMKELQSYWKGNSADRFQQNVSFDIFNLKCLGGVFKKLSDDYDFAVIEYEKNKQRSIDIVNAI